jgi:hypothetical protein
MVGEVEEPIHRWEENRTTIWIDGRLQKRDKWLMQMKKC